MLREVKKLLISIIVSMILFSGVFFGFYYFYNNLNKEQKIVLDLDKIELADTDQEREIGLMNREELCAKCGMLFEFENEKILSFWMKNTLIPLDMLFLDKQGKIVTIHENTLPLRENPNYSSTKPAKYVLETNAGFSKKQELEVNNIIDVNKLKRIANK